MDDSKILGLLLNRSEDSIAAMAGKYGRRLLATARNILGSAQDAEECVSDTYLAVWNAVPPKTPNPLSAFVYRCGKNLALKRYRHNTAAKRDSSYDLSLDELAECIPAPGLEETVEARELGRAIDAFLDTCSRETRIIFLRRYWFGDSVHDIARQMGLTTGAVTTRLSRTRSQLRNYLIQEGYENE